MPVVPLIATLTLSCAATTPRPARFIDLGVQTVYAVSGAGQFDGTRYAMLTLEVFNDSPTAAVDVEVACVLGEMHMATIVRRVVWRAFTNVTLYAPEGTIENELPRGRQRARCVVRSLASSAPPEVRPGNEEASVDLVLEPTQYPDLVFDPKEAIRARECEQQAEPVSTRAVCLHVAWTNGGRATYRAPFKVRCTLDDNRYAEETYDFAPLPAMRNTTILRFNDIDAGGHIAHCSLDVDATVHEASKANNSAQASIAVLSNEAEWIYDLAIERIDHVARSIDRPPPGSTPQPDIDRHGISVTVRNTGRFAIDAGIITCTSGARRTTGGWGTGVGAPRLQPSESLSITLIAEGKPPPAETWRCEVKSTSPARVVDRTPRDNVRIGEVRAVAP